MPRTPRGDVPAGIYHLTARGNRGQPIFLDALDRNRFLEGLADVVRRHRWRCLVYCLMGNHFHLIVRTVDATLSAGMHRVNGAYAQRFNVRHGFSGHVFEDRFASRTIARTSHLHEAARYVVLNPVRAGLCDRAAEWAWSSYRATVNLAARPPFLAVDEVLAEFGPSRPKARSAFAAFVADGVVRGRP